MAPSGIPIPNPRAVSLFLLELEGEVHPAESRVVPVYKSPILSHVIKPFPEPAPNFVSVPSMPVLIVSVSYTHLTLPTKA